MPEKPQLAPRSERAPEQPASREQLEETAKAFLRLMSAEICGVGESIHGRATHYLYEHPDLPKQQRELLTSIKVDAHDFTKSVEHLLRGLIGMSPEEWDNFTSQFYLGEYYPEQRT